MEGCTKKEIRKALIAAYPFGEMSYHPYKIWLDEIKVQMGEKKPKVKIEILQKDRLFDA